MLIAGGKCFGLCNIRWKISQLFSALFLEILCMRNYAACLWWLDELYDIYIYMEITHVQWLWKPPDMLTESCQKAIHLQCKNCNILKKNERSIKIEGGWNWGGHYLIAKTSSFLKEHNQPLGWSGDQALWQSSIEFCLGQIQRPNCLSLPSKTYNEPEIK